MDNMKSMNYGIALPYTSARAIATLCQAAEEAGWDGCFTGDAIWCEDPMIGLAAAAMTTDRIRLGTMVTPVPLRKPWKLASESVALDHLSNGRLILGLATGAAWMGWQAFPDEVTDARQRAEMLDETIDILTLLYARRPFDYDGRHYQVKLTRLPDQYYPPKPQQQPRIPLWCVGIWPQMKSMQRALKCDGVIVEKPQLLGAEQPITPADIAAIRAYVQENRAATTPFDIVVVGKSLGLEPGQREDTLSSLAEAGATWWVEGLWDEPVEQVRQQIENGPPGRAV
jgi:hypothetical protein